ncbi:MAG: ABC transporter ATP-binding protein [Pseudomonadota bacterium]
MSAVAASAEHLGKTIGDRVVLNDISAQVRPGDVVGIIGKNGAGKTTLLETLLGLSMRSSGSSTVLGEDSLHLSTAAKQRIGFVPQQEELIPALSGRRQLALTGSFYRNWDRELVARLATEWEVPLDRRAHTLSGGERQKLSTLMALGNHPDLLVLDEPVASLDPVARRKFLQQVLEIASDNSRAVIFSTHIVSDLERVANRIWILKDGRLIWDGETDALKESVVRLHIRARAVLPQDLGIPNCLSTRRSADGLSATVAVRDLSVTDTDALASRLGVDIEREGLGLEDIFLEIHS